jgi:putative FmdB family regulatory protein
MPTYVYECARCGDEFELWQSFSDDPLKKHPGCGGKVTKVLQPVGIVLKGSGFYKNDSRTGSRKGAGKKPEAAESSSSSGDSSKSDSGSSDTKSTSPKSDGNGAGSSKDSSSKDKKPSTPASKAT